MTEHNSQWHTIPNWENLYETNRFGQIKSVQSKIILKPHFDNNGYPSIRLSKNGKQKHLRIHRLVTAAFFGKCKKGFCVNHIDGNKKNCAIKNLEYVSYSENNAHAYRINLRDSKGEKQHRSILNNNQVLEIKRLFKSGLSPTKISKFLGLSFNAIYGITNRGNWSHV